MINRIELGFYYKFLNDILIKLRKKVLLITTKNMYNNIISKNNIVDTFDFVLFTSFSPNPKYEEVVEGVRRFKENECEMIIAIGGGSAIDVAKCIKLFCNLDDSKNYLHQQFNDSKIPLIAIPTTAGTGSESTKFAVIYYNAEKQSITHESIVPDYAILDSTLLNTLPLYQKKCTLTDALCQAIESWWSINSTNESKQYSKLAVEGIIKNYQLYLNGDVSAAKSIMLASNFSGRAINITQTTAPHAMSYKITSLYSIPHGHAVGLCLPVVWKFMITNLDKCIDKRGIDYLTNTFNEIAFTLGHANVESAIIDLSNMLETLGLEYPITSNSQDIFILAESVNITRLSNNPIRLNYDDLLTMYTQIIRK